nr:hypothetical protein [Caldilineaceae bacterium]
RLHPALPPQAAAQFKAVADTVQFVDTAAAEFTASPATFAQVRAVGDLGDKPLYVLSATEHGMPAEVEQLGAELQTELAGLSSNSIHQTVPGSDHASLLIKEEDAKATSTAILAVVEAVRSGQRLVRKQ